jgi:hypothetical protein
LAGFPFPVFRFLFLIFFLFGFGSAGLGLALCAVPAVESLARQRSGRVLLLVLFISSVTIQAVGAYGDWNEWNYAPAPLESQPERVWDWRDLQIVRTMRGKWRGAELAPLLCRC